MASGTPLPSGEFHTTYKADMTLFPSKMSRLFCAFGVLVLLLLPLNYGGFQFVDAYLLNLMIQIGIYGIGALGLNILVGFTGQISLGHSAFFGFGAFASAWINNTTGIPVFFSIPLGALLTTAVGLIVGIPAARIRGLYLAIATLASQFILEDFFNRADWFSGGASGALAEPFTLFGYAMDTDVKYYYVVLAYMVIMYIAGSNLLRTRDGRAFIAVRDHYLSAEMMGINLTKYRILAFGISSFYAGLAGALFGHYLGFVSAEGFTILLSIQFLGMIIIGGLGSVMGTLMGTAFMVLLPEVMEAIATGIGHMSGGSISALTSTLPYLKEAAIGLAIILFLIFEPDGLANRWRLIKSYWKLYPFSY
ncbi:MAG: branched-chain amino acid ABC transporter permease [Minwuiales bacterium]|nr:branched-chain amino acid ABC transporter permease [Minwuiales bacterium]